MQVLKYQMITMEDVICYETDICIDDKAQLLQLIHSTSLDLQMVNKRKKVVLAFELKRRKIFFVYIPILEESKNNCDYSCAGIKKTFHLENALKVRCEGNFTVIEQTINNFERFIVEKGYTKITEYYLAILLEHSSEDFDHMVVDIYVGISWNIL